MSAALHMVTNGGDTEGLFRGTFMNSGALLSSGDISLGQQEYDNLVRATGCAGVEDTLECLRQVPFPALKEAVNMSPMFVSYRVRHDSLNPLSAVTNLTCSQRTLPGSRGRMGRSSKPHRNNCYCRAASPRFHSSQVAKIPKFCVSQLTDRSGHFRQLRRRRNPFRLTQPQRYVSGSLGMR